RRLLGQPRRGERRVELGLVDLLGRGPVRLAALHYSIPPVVMADPDRSGPSHVLLDCSGHNAQSATVMPIERAVPAMIRSAWSRSLALRSGSLVCAISRTWSRVTVATLVLCGSPEPFSTPAAASSSLAAGGVLVTNVKLRSSNTEISTGTTWPRCD